MTYREIAEAYQWWKQECASIAECAQRYGYTVTPDQVGKQLTIWRYWVSRIINDETLTRQTGIRKEVSDGSNPAAIQ